jgi:hypothetical protein
MYFIRYSSKTNARKERTHLIGANTGKERTGDQKGTQMSTMKSFAEAAVTCTDGAKDAYQHRLRVREFSTRCLCHKDR